MSRKTYTNKITSPTLTANINPENRLLADRFLKDKAIRSSSETIAIYRSNLNIFFTWNMLSNGNKFYTDIKRIELADFFSFADTSLKIGASRMNSLRSVLSSLSNFVEKFYGDDYPGFRNVVLKVIESTPKDTRREKTVLTDAQVEGLLAHLFTTDRQKACWLALAVSTGARFSELLRFDVDIIDETRTAFGDLFLETTRQIKTKGRGKAGKLLYKYIIRDKFMPYYKTWLAERAIILAVKGQDHNSMFIKQDGTPATEGAVRLWFADFEQVLGVPFYPHALCGIMLSRFSAGAEFRTHSFRRL